MTVECARVKVPVFVKAHITERDAIDANGLSILKHYNDIRHAHPCPGKTLNPVTRWIPKHLIELGVRQAIQVIVWIEKEYAARHAHRVSARNEPGRPRLREEDRLTEVP
jgi:hypothetical protein